MTLVLLACKEQGFIVKGSFFSITCGTWYRPSRHDPNKIQQENEKTEMSLGSLGILMGCHWSFCFQKLIGTQSALNILNRPVRGSIEQHWYLWQARGTVTQRSRQRMRLEHSLFLLPCGPRTACSWMNEFSFPCSKVSGSKDLCHLSFWFSKKEI